MTMTLNLQHKPLIKNTPYFNHIRSSVNKVSTNLLTVLSATRIEIRSVYLIAAHKKQLTFYVVKCSKERAEQPTFH